MESDSRLLLDAADGAVWVSLAQYLVWRGIAQNVDPAKLQIMVFSNTFNLLSTPFYGTVLAPAGMIEMGTGAPDWYYGRFYARRLEAHQNTRIVRVPFEP